MMNRTLIASFAAATAVFGACAAKPAPVPEPDPAPEPTSVSSYILLDRTGSMAPLWDEALTSVNAYAAEVGQERDDAVDVLETDVTLAVFDAQDGLQFDVLRQKVEPGEWDAVTSDEVSPRGMTPLFDAIVQIVSLAEADAPEKAVIVIMTDGDENSSREVTRDGAKAALDRIEQKGWEVVFLGADFGNFDDAEAVGVSAAKQMAIAPGSMQSSMERIAQKSRNYAKGADEAMAFNEEDRAVANEEAVKDRDGN